jgi:hypothetical protein
MPISSDILGKYLSPIFVETGSNRGDGVQAAMDAGFECIYSVEVAPYCHGWCAHRFWDFRTRVHLFGMDSRKFLKWIMPRITTQVTFWLDAHFCQGEGGTVDDVPLLEELKIIRKHDVKTHRILIDDVRLMGTDDLPVSLSRVMTSLKKINPDYQITRIDSPEFKDDILVADPPPIICTP